MQRQNMRVILASEYPEIRHFMKEVVEEDGSVIVGQAQDVSRALTLARDLRPDVALVDCRLPHVVGLDTVPLSRMGGLDTVQTIFEELPNTRVILLVNLDTEILAGYGLGSNSTAIFYIDWMGTDTSVALRDLYYEIGQSNAPVFANVKVKPRATAAWNITKLNVRDVVFNGIPILCIFGLVGILAVMTGTMLLLAFPGAAVFGLGIGFLIKRLKRAKIKR